MDARMDGCVCLYVLLTHISCLQRSVPAHGCMRRIAWMLDHVWTVLMWIGVCMCLSTRVHVCIYVCRTQQTCTHQGIQGHQAHGLWSFGRNSIFFNPATFASWHYWIDRQLIQFHGCDYVHLPLLFQALSWKAWVRTSKVSKARLAVTLSTVAKQNNAWNYFTF